MLHRHLVRWATESPGYPAWISSAGNPLSWRTLAACVAETGDRLRDLGVRPGDRVVTQVPNGWASVAIALALDAVDATESPVDTRVSLPEVQRRAGLLDATLMIDLSRAEELTMESLASTGSAIAVSSMVERAPQPNHPALILWTSGTTAEPKGVVLTRGAIEANARGKLAAAPQRPEDVRLTVLSLSHAYARTCDLVTWILSGGALAAGDGWEAVYRLGPRVRPTLMNSVPYLLDRIFGPLDEASESSRTLPAASVNPLVPLEAARDRLRELGLDRLRMLGCGGVALPPERFNQIRRLGIAPIQGYGLTEAGPVVCSATPEDARPGVVGRPIPGMEVRVLETGELVCRGPGQMREYWRDAASTAERVNADGWLRTGDAATIEPDGAVRILGRLDDVIVLGTGRKVWPENVERLLRTVAGVRHVIVRGNGGGLEAWVDADDGVSAGTLLERFAERVAGHPETPPIKGVHLLRPRLSMEAGELTAKGTVRRAVVLSRVGAEY